MRVMKHRRGWRGTRPGVDPRQGQCGTAMLSLTGSVLPYFRNVNVKSDQTVSYRGGVTK